MGRVRMARPILIVAAFKTQSLGMCFERGSKTRIRRGPPHQFRRNRL